MFTNNILNIFRTKYSQILCNKLFFLAIIIFTISACVSTKNQSTLEIEKRSTTIATGQVKGLYYPTGKAICKSINKGYKYHGIRCNAKPHVDSTKRIWAILSDEYDFGIVQSDHLWEIWEGTRGWGHNSDNNKNLRTVFSIFPESVQLIATVDSGINDLSDLKGKTVSIRRYGSDRRTGSHIDVDNALDTVGIDSTNDIEGINLEYPASIESLQEGRLDAAFFVLATPSGLVQKATSGKKKVRFIDILNSDSLTEKYPYYARSSIPISFYPKAVNDKDVQTFGVKATLITSAKVPDDVVYNLTKSVFENFKNFKKDHLALKHLSKEMMLEALAAPIHPGALRYYEEVGLR